MTSTFEANFYNIEAIEDRIVTPDGRISGLGRFKGRNVKIVVMEEDEVLGDDPACDLHPWTNPSYYVEVGTRTPDQEVEISGSTVHINDADVQITPTTEEIIEASG